MDFVIDLSKIKIVPFKDDWETGFRSFHKQKGLDDAEINKAVQQEKKRQNDQFEEYIADIYDFFGESLKDIRGNNSDDVFYEFINSFLSGEELKDFMFSVRFLYHVENFISNSGAGLKTLFLISFVESLTTDDYLRLEQWLLDKSNKNDVINALNGLNLTNYNDKFG